MNSPGLNANQYPETDPNHWKAYWSISYEDQTNWNVLQYEILENFMAFTTACSHKAAGTIVELVLW